MGAIAKYLQDIGISKKGEIQDARKTINFIMKIIKKALKDAVRLGILVKNPADGIELLAEDSRERGILSPVEVEKLFHLEWSDERGKIASILAAVSGMRLSEIIALQIDNLDTERNIIHVQHSLHFPFPPKMHVLSLSAFDVFPCHQAG
jgi:integrase